MATWSLIIFGICAVMYIWDKLPMSLTALLGLLAMILTGIVDFETGFKNFGSTTVVLICSMMVVGRAAYRTGLARVVGEKVVRLSGGNERLVVIISTALTAVLSAFLSNIATLAVMISILTGICSGNKRVRFMNVIMPVSMAAVIGGAATLVGSTTQLTAQGIVEEYLGLGRGFNFATFLIPGGIIVVFLVLYAGFIGYPLGKRIWGNRPEYDIGPAENSEESYNTAAEKPNKSKMYIMAVIFIASVLMFAFCDLIAKVIPGFNLGTASLLSAVVCVLTGCIPHKEAIKSVNWSLAIWFCASLGIASGIIKSGGGELLAGWFVRLLGTNVSPLVIYAVFLVLIVILTQFLANSTALAIVLPIVFSLTESLNLNTFSFAVGLTIAGAMAVATPLANTTIGMSMVANYKFSDYIKYAGPVTIVAMVILLVVVPALYPLA